MTLLDTYTSLTPMADGTWIAYVPSGTRIAGGRQCMVYHGHGARHRPAVSDNGCTMTAMVDHVDVVVGNRVLRISREDDARALRERRLRLRIGRASA